MNEDIKTRQTALLAQIDSGEEYENFAHEMADFIVQDVTTLLDGVDDLHLVITANLEYSIANWLDAQAHKQETSSAMQTLMNAAEAVRTGEWKT